MTDTTVGGEDTLSLETIDELLAEVASRPPGTARMSSVDPLPFDFRRPNQFSRDHVRALQIVHEGFARRMGTILSTTLRAVSQVSLTAVDQLTYDEYVRSTPNPSLLAILSIQPLPGAGILHLPVPLAMGILDRLLGGPGSGDHPLRPLSDIEIVLLRDLLERGLGELGTAFESLVPIEPEIVQLESNPQFAQVASPNDMVVVVTFDVRLGGEEDVLTACYPLASLQPTLERVGSRSLFVDRRDEKLAAAADTMVTILQDVPVDACVHFEAVSVPSEEIATIAPGDVLPLGHPVGEPLTVTVGGVPLLAAQPTKNGRRLACRIVDPQRSPA